MRPNADAVENKAVAFCYKWKETLPVLEALAAEESSDPFDGVLLEYTNPLTGGPTLPTIGASVQMLRPGETTRLHRHTRLHRVSHRAGARRDDSGKSTR